MRATIQSTDRIVDIDKGGKIKARVWEGVSYDGIKFTAYLTLVQVAREADNTEFERELQEHKQPDAETVRAIDARFVL